MVNSAVIPYTFKYILIYIIWASISGTSYNYLRSPTDLNGELGQPNRDLEPFHLCFPFCQTSCASVLSWNVLSLLWTFVSSLVIGRCFRSVPFRVNAGKNREILRTCFFENPDVSFLSGKFKKFWFHWIVQILKLNATF